MGRGRRAIPKRIVQSKAILQRETLDNVGYLKVMKYFVRTHPSLL